VRWVPRTKCTISVIASKRRHNPSKKQYSDKKRSRISRAVHGQAQQSQPEQKGRADQPEQQPQSEHDKKAQHKQA
jgi:hypothetical protein